MTKIKFTRALHKRHVFSLFLYFATALFSFAQTYEARWDQLISHKTPECLRMQNLEFLFIGAFTQYLHIMVSDFMQNGTPRDMYRSNHDSYDYHVKSYGYPGVFGLCGFY